MSIFQRLLVVVIFLLIVADCSFSQTFPPNCNTEKGLFSSYPGQKLTLPKGAMKKTKFVTNSMQCAFACIGVHWCRSVNFKIAPRSNGLHACQLISSDKFAGKQYMGPNKAYNHYTLKNPCQEIHCRNGGKCILQCNRQHYHCDCREGFGGEHCEKVHGNWSPWKPWGACSVTCGGGSQSRSRTCSNPAPAHGGNDCEGNKLETRRCGETACPVNGGWSSWEPWRACSVKCGGGNQSRSRTCSNPAPAHGGKDCEGKSVETQKCGDIACKAKHCVEVLQNGNKQSGEYFVYPDGQQSFKVYCDQKTAGGGWTVFQRRKDGSVDFYRGWNDYKNGFGDLNGEFWLGLDKIHRLTQAKRNRLRVDLEDAQGNTAYAEYDYFAVSSEPNKYKLGLGSYSGTAGDGLSSHNGMNFTTKDSDNDNYSDNCAHHGNGAWWYNSCFESNLKGIYSTPGTVSHTYVTWYHWKKSLESLKAAEMKMKPV